MPKRCLSKGNVDNSRARQGLAQSVQPKRKPSSTQHQHHSGSPDQLGPSIAHPDQYSLCGLQLDPKKSGGRRQTSISPLRGSIPRHPGQRSSTENTADCVAHGQKSPDLQVVAWPVSSKEERKHLGSLSTRPRRAHALHPPPLAFGSDLFGPVTIVWLFCLFAN